MALRRISYEMWQRNLAVALGNAPFDSKIVHVLSEQLQSTSSDLVREHICWAIAQQKARANN